MLPAVGGLLVGSASAGLHPATVSAGNVPWPGGDVPFEMDGSLSVDQKQTYLDGLREWELAAKVHFIPHTTEPRWVLFKYVANGPNRVTEDIDGLHQVVEIGLLTRGQICHEMGHSFGLEHEHQRADRDSFITVLYGNVVSGHNDVFDILPGSVQFGSYDFESVMHYGRDVFTTAPGFDTIQVKPGFEKFQSRLSNAALSPTDRAHLASLYGAPLVPLSSVVTTTTDGGAGSLRAAIYFAQDHPGTAVTFNIPPSDPGFAGGAFTIRPTGSLPPLATPGLVIDATTQPGYAGKPVVFLNGSKLPQDGTLPGLLFYEANGTVKGLGIQQFPWSGVVMRYPDATGNRIVGCSVGVDFSGNAAVPNSFQGIMIADGAHGNFIGGTGPDERNVISGSAQYGIWISGSTTASNSVLGNYIGTNSAGTAPLANQAGGVILINGAHHNVIGGDTAASRNIISGNVDAGIWIIGSGSNSVRGNYIGTNAAGSAELANTGVGIGVQILAGASNNWVSGNVLSGNAAEGLRIAGNTTTGNQVYGNLAGTSPDGNSQISNGFAGVTVVFGAKGNQVGGTLAGQRNVLSGNGTVGLVIGSTGTQGNFAFGNYIGTDAGGTAALPNGFAGVYLTGGASGNYLGNGPGTGNLVSGNATVGVLIADMGTRGNFICNNRIGPDSSGGSTLSSQFEGIRLDYGCQANLIGGATQGAANIISGNGGLGIVSYNANPEVDGPTVGNTIQRNSIFDNDWQGIALNAGSNHSQPEPVISSAVLGIGTTIAGTLAGTPNTPYTVEFFASPGSRSFVGEFPVTTNGGGSASINVTLPAVVPAGREITATATSQSTGDTSQFSIPVAVTAADGDSDGLPNSYETATPGLNPSNPADAALDRDGDGFTNLQEFVAGTNPNDPTSRLIATGALSGGNFKLTFPTVAGKFYRVERTEVLAGLWETVAVNVAGTGGPVLIPLPVSPSISRQFFRVTAGD
ncbi:right-handed parallel beta-helix repeat-containing protein [bacterium]|nr:right-handed parallel beta-helix repeat-containing protein [bacterium]